MSEQKNTQAQSKKRRRRGFGLRTLFIAIPEKAGKRSLTKPHPISFSPATYEQRMAFRPQVIVDNQFGKDVSCSIAVKLPNLFVLVKFTHVL